MGWVHLIQTFLNVPLLVVTAQLLFRQLVLSGQLAQGTVSNLHLPAGTEEPPISVVCQGNL